MILPNGGVGVGPDHAERLIHSYRRLTGNELLPGPESSGSLTERLFLSPIVVLSHGTEDDPVLNYGNQAALNLWEMDWETFPYPVKVYGGRDGAHAARAVVEEGAGARICRRLHRNPHLPQRTKILY